MHRNRIWPFGNPGERTQRNRILPLSGPGGFRSTAAPLTTTSTRVTWTLPKAPADSYRLERSTDKLNWTTVASGLTVLTADDTGRAESTLYYYRVISVVGGLDKETSEMSETWTVPSTPTGLTATPISGSQINLAWTDVSTGNTAQIVERRNPPTTGTYSVIATVGATTAAYNDETVSAGVTYEYRVAATNPTTQSAYSNAATATATGSVPTTPVVTVGTVTTNSIALSWTSTGATTYTVEWSADGGVTYQSVGEYTNNTATSVTDGSLTSDTGYDYRVRATNAFGNSGYGTASATTGTVPAAPSGFTATSTFADSVSLAWTDNQPSGSSAETGFDIEVSTNAGGTYSSVTTTAANATSYTHTGRTESTAYLYRIRSTNAAGSSAWVVASSVTTPAALTGLTATATSSTQINLAWTDKSSVETGFRIERSTDNVTFSLVTTTAANATSYSNTGLTASTLYYYRVRSNSYNGTNDSAWYSASATTQAGIASPTYEIDFTTDNYIGTKFSRASRGTFVNSSGYIQAAEMTLVPQGGRENFANAVWDNTSNSTVTANTSTSPDGATKATTYTESAGVNLERNRLRSSIPSGGAANTTYTFSIYLKNALTAGRQFAYIRVFNFGTGGGLACYAFDLVNGTVGGSLQTVITSSAGIENVGSGWYRCRVTFTTTTANIQMGIGLCDSATPTFNTGDGRVYYTVTAGNEKSILVWGGQLVQGSTAQMFVGDASSNNGTPRVTYDPVTLTNRGLLLEQQATNLITYSEDFANVSWTLNTATISTNGGAFWTSPANTSTARALTQTAGNSNHAVRQQFANVTQAGWSVFAKKSTTSGVGRYVSLNVRSVSDYVYAVFDLDSGTITQSANVGTVWSNPVYQIENYGNGWYRLFVGASRSSGTVDFLIALANTGTPTMDPTGQVYNAANSTDGVYIWGAQYEATLSPTSYISTAGASVTRSGDVFGLVSADLSPFWNQTAGSLVINNRWYALLSQNAACRAGTAGATSSMMTDIASFGNSQQCLIKNVSSAYSGPNAALVINTDYKVGFAYDNGPNFKGFRNGSAGVNVTSVTIPTVDKMEFGTNQNNNMVATNTGGTGSNYTISRLRYWNTKLSDGDMQTLTT